jgi:ketosteroid isomerase-like protein
VTCWLEQDYVLDNQPQHISAPTTIVLRRLGDGWRLVLTHSIPLPEHASA